MQLTEYPRVRQGQQTRQRLLELITEDPSATLNELSQKLCLSTSQIRRHRKYLRILGLLPLVIFMLFIFAPSALANEIISEGDSVEDVEQEPVDQSSIEEDEPEEEPDEKPE